MLGAMGGVRCGVRHVAAAGKRGMATGAGAGKPLYRTEVMNSSRSPTLKGHATMAMHYVEPLAPPCIHLSKAKGSCHNTSLVAPIAIATICSGIAAWRAHLSTIQQ
eukprot:COSAG02_NODE_23_length_52893_cov_58.101868_37_plen_106_part_00